MHDTVLATAGWISTGTGIGNDIKSLIFDVGIPVLCGLFVLVVGWRTKAPGPTIMAVILAAVVWGGAANMSLLKDKTTQDITHYDGPASAQQGDR
ncbi:hypothetical protein AB0K43_30040 [Kitasatospora sp. NPDC049258]|uniref:hypothetical protein n=1 Tax=Kitasatospora sp. NPDC049258 TaxID=3155394 RepID=UPI003440B118